MTHDMFSISEKCDTSAHNLYPQIHLKFDSQKDHQMEPIFRNPLSTMASIVGEVGGLPVYCGLLFKRNLWSWFGMIINSVEILRIDSRLNHQQANRQMLTILHLPRCAEGIPEIPCFFPRGFRDFTQKYHKKTLQAQKYMNRRDWSKSLQIPISKCVCLLQLGRVKQPFICTPARKRMMKPHGLGTTASVVEEASSNPQYHNFIRLLGGH